MYWTVHLDGGPKRVNHAAVIVGEKVYSFGGYCSGENYRVETPIDVHILNTVSLSWKLYFPPKKSKNDAPYQRYGHTAVAHGTKVYLWGGRNDEAACNKLYCFDTGIGINARNRESKTKTLGIGAFGRSKSGIWFVFDTGQYSACLATSRDFDHGPPNQKLEWSCVKTSGFCPGARDGHSACIIDDCMYIFGGFEDDEDRFSQDVYKLDLTTFVWSFVVTRGDPPSYRDFHSATAIDHRMFVFGGRGDQSAPYHSQMELYCNNIVYLDVRECTWVTPTTTGNTPIGRRSHSAFVYNGDIYIFGGYNSLRNMHFNDLHRFDPYKFHWQEIKPLGDPPSKRRRQSCVVNGNQMFLFGGTSPVETNSIEESFFQDLFTDNDPESKLNDHDDLHILELAPTLKILCLAVVIKYKLDISQLPEDLKSDVRIMTTKNGIQRLFTAG